MTYWHDDQSAHPPIGTWMWHLHHDVLCEPLTAPLAVRLAFIREAKPADEVDLRLRLIDSVAGSIPAALVKALAAFEKAFTHWMKTGRTAPYDTASTAHKAWEKAQPTLEALHAIEHPDCPWDGYSIFAEVPA